MRNQKAKPCAFLRRLRREDAGQALVELALSIGLLALLLLGAAEFGRLAYMAIEVSDAAKAAAQYGAQNQVTASDLDGIRLAARKHAPYVNDNCTAFTADVQDPIQCSCVADGKRSDPTVSACNDTCSGYIVEQLVISTSASCNPIIHVPGLFSGGITLHGGAVQEVLN